MKQVKLQKNENGGVENEKKDKNFEGEKSERLIDVDSILRKTKSQLLEESGRKQEVLSYVKLPYPHLSKKKEK